MEVKEGRTPDDAMRALDSVSGKVKNEPKLQKLQTKKEVLNFQTLLENPAQISCRNGSVYGMNIDLNTTCREYIFCYYQYLKRFSLKILREPNIPK